MFYSSPIICCIDLTSFNGLSNSRQDEYSMDMPCH